MVPEALYPSLAEAKPVTGYLMAKISVHGIDPKGDSLITRLVYTFVRLVDGSVIDYQLQRAAHYAYWREPGLGSSVPLSQALVPMFSHIENCLTNTHRALLFCDAIRRRRPMEEGKPLVDRNAWKVLEAVVPRIRAMRDAVQHADEMLLEGRMDAAAIMLLETGELNFGGARLMLAELAETLKRLRAVTEGVVELLPRSEAAGRERAS